MNQPTPQKSQTRVNLHTCTIDGIFATPWAVLSIPGSFLMAGLLNAFFDIGAFWFGIVSATPALANAMNIFLIPLAAKFMRVRDMTLCFSCINVGLWLSGIVAMAFLPIGSAQTAGLFFAVFYGLTALSLSLGAVGWSAWVGDFVPTEIRGRFMAGRNRYTNISTLAFMLLSLWLLDLLDASRTAYIILVSLAVFARLISVLVQFRIQSPDPTGGAVASANWAKEIHSLLKEHTLMRFICFGAVSGFFIGFAGALCPLYALQHLGASPAEFTGYSIAATVAGTLCVRLWGKLIDRHGAAPVVLICFFGWRLGDIAWTLITPETRIWMFALWTWGGALATGYMLASFNLILKLIPAKSRSAGISLNLTIVSIVAATAPILAGSLINWAETHNANVVATYRIALAASAVGALLSCLFMVGLKEPATNPSLNTIYGAMRTLRSLTVTQGLTFLSNTTFIARRKKKSD
jgi:MFS family permease